MSKHCRRTGFNGSCRVADPNMHGFLGSWGPMAPPARSFSSTIRKDLYALMASPSRAPRHSVRSMHAKHQVATIGRCPMESMCIDDLATTSVLVRRACWARGISWRNGWRRFPKSCMHQRPRSHERLVSPSVPPMQDARLSRLAGALRNLCALMT